VFEPLRKRIADAVEKLEEQIAIAESDGTGSEEELKKAKEALEAGQKIAEQEKEQEKKETSGN
jgi:tubulin-specific chaperone A